MIFNRIQNSEICKFFSIITKQILAEAVNCSYVHAFNIVAVFKLTDDLINQYIIVSTDLSHHIIDIVDYATIMAYRDFAEGIDGIIYHSEDEVTYAASVDKKVVVGVETMGFGPDNTDNPEKITFYEEGEVYMNQELEKVIEYYTEGLKGVAIHYYLTYKELH